MPRRPGLIGRRLVAAWIDGAVCYGCTIAVITVAEVAIGLRLPLEPTFVALAGLIGARWLARRGSTLGKILVGLRVTRGDGTPLGVRGALAREVLGKWVLSLGVPLVAARIAVGQGWIPSLYDLLIACGVLAVVGIRCAITGRTWHDRVAGTLVERASSTAAAARRSLGIVAGAVALAAIVAGVSYRSSGWIPAKHQLYRDPRPIGRYVDFLHRTSETPIDHILRVFDRADVVILGENLHPEATQWDFIFDLVRDPRFVDRVGRVFTEYGFAEDQPALDRFLSTPGLPPREVDRQAVALMRNLADGHNTGWDNTNFFTYLQRLYRLDESLPADKRVRHFFTDKEPGFLEQTRDRAATIERAKVDRDRRMAQTVIDQLARDRSPDGPAPKALVIMNYRHAFAPVQLFGESMDNAGRYLFEAFPGRTANFLLGPQVVPFAWAPLQGGRWDAAWAATDHRPVGFDLTGSPFGDDAFDLFSFPPGLKGRYRYRDVYTGMLLVTPLHEQVLERGVPGYFDGFEVEALRRAALVSDDMHAHMREAIAWYRAGTPGRRMTHPTYSMQTTVELVTLAVFALGMVWALIAFWLGSRVAPAATESEADRERADRDQHPR